MSLSVLHGVLLLSLFSNLSQAADDSWLSHLVLGQDLRCLKEEIRPEATRHGFDAWLNGSNPQPNIPNAQARLRKMDLEQVRTTEIAIDEALLSQAATLAFSREAPPMEFKFESVRLRCHPPQIKLGSVEDGKIFLEIACDTFYSRPWKSECISSDTHPCTLLQIGLKLSLSEPDFTSSKSKLSAEVALEKPHLSLPSVEQLVNAKALEISQDIEGYTNEIKANLESATDLKQASQDAIDTAKKKYSPTHKVVRQLESSLKQISEYLSLLTQLGSDQTALLSFSHNLLAISPKDATSFDQIFSKIAPSVQKLLTQVGALKTQVGTVKNLVALLQERMDGSEKQIESSLAGLRDQTASLTATLSSIDAAVEAFKKVLAAAPLIGVAQDKIVATFLESLEEDLKQELLKIIPHSFPLMTLKPLVKDFDVPKLNGKLQLIAQFGTPRIENNPAFGRKALVIPIKMKPLEIIPTKAAPSPLRPDDRCNEGDTP